MIPEQTRETARAGRPRGGRATSSGGCASAPRAAVTGALDRRPRTRRPRRPADVDWDRTIRANLRHYQPEQRTVVPERLVGYGREAAGGAARRDPRASTSRGSMAVLGRLRSGLRRGAGVAAGRCARGWSPSTPSVVDLTGELHDPVDVLFGTQLGGGTDINQAVGLLPVARSPGRPTRSSS